MTSKDCTQGRWEVHQMSPVSRTGVLLGCLDEEEGWEVPPRLVCPYKTSSLRTVTGVEGWRDRRVGVGSQWAYG